VEPMWNQHEACYTCVFHISHTSWRVPNIYCTCDIHVLCIKGASELKLPSVYPYYQWNQTSNPFIVFI
jgi:hypothetical protein